MVKAAAQEQYVLPPVERGKKRLRKAEEWVDEEEERKFLELVGEPLIKVEHHHVGKDNWNEDSDSPVHSLDKRPALVNKRSEDDFNELLKTSPKKKRKQQSHARDEQWE